MKTASAHLAFLAATAVTTILLAGCDNRHLIGEFDGGPSDDGAPMFPADGAINLPDLSPDRPDSRPTIPDAAPPDGAVVNQDGAVLGPVQSWTGYIENYKFGSGSDAIKIAFTSDAAGNAVGTVKMGSGTPPPPPTDPNVGYPPGFVGPGIYFETTVVEGFGYPMLDGTFDGRRLQFGVGFWEFWEGWCAIQPPVPGSSLCLPNWGGMRSADGICSQRNPDTGELVVVDCGKLSLCTMVAACTCGPSTCASRDAGTQITFDVALATSNPSLADGSVAGQLGDHNVHLTKDP